MLSTRAPAPCRRLWSEPALVQSQASEQGRPPEHTSKFYAKGALQYLVPILTQTLTKQVAAPEALPAPSRGRGSPLQLPVAGRERRRRRVEPLQGGRRVPDAAGHLLRGRRAAPHPALHQGAHRAPRLALQGRLGHGLRLHPGRPRAQPAQTAHPPGGARLGPGPGRPSCSPSCSCLSRGCPL